jgi:hypothetical protein
MIIFVVLLIGLTPINKFMTQKELEIIYNALIIYYQNESDVLDPKDKADLMYRISKLQLKDVSKFVDLWVELEMET